MRALERLGLIKQVVELINAELIAETIIEELEKSGSEPTFEKCRDVWFEITGANEGTIQYELEFKED